MIHADITSFDSRKEAVRRFKIAHCDNRAEQNTPRICTAGIDIQPVTALSAAAEHFFEAVIHKHCLGVVGRYHSEQHGEELAGRLRIEYRQVVAVVYIIAACIDCGKKSVAFAVPHRGADRFLYRFGAAATLLRFFLVSEKAAVYFRCLDIAAIHLAVIHHVAHSIARLCVGESQRRHIRRLEHVYQRVNNVFPAFKEGAVILIGVFEQYLQKQRGIGIR